MSAIQRQVELPVSVAFEVVLQGIRIRLGRSVVTMMGIVLGVAFLMSILSANLIRKGVAGESEARQEIQRMLGFLTAETGPLDGRTITVFQGGVLSDVEVRLLVALEAQSIGRMDWFSPSGSLPPARLRTVVPVSGMEDPGRDAVAILLAGDLVPDAELKLLLSQVRSAVLVSARREVFAKSDLAVISLARELREEEIVQSEKLARRDRARSIWIISIALLVTIICITNSLLMSVTERFKEIGTMKCLGALSSFIRQIYFIESSMLGIIGSLIGALAGLLFAIMMYGLTYGFGLVLAALSPSGIALIFFISVVGGIVSAIIAAIYPASFASRMVPATALRTNI